jgi:hypothetical protein
MKNLIKNKDVFVLNYVAISISLVSFFFVFFNLINLFNRSLVVHFDDINGVTKMGNFTDIILIAVTGIIVTVLNFFISIEVEKKDKFLARIISIVSILFAVLLFIAFTAILTMN